MATAGVERPLNIVLIDGDPLQRGAIIDYLAERRQVEVTEIDTEHGFREALPGLIEQPPDMFIMELLMRWADPIPGAPPVPEDVREGGHFRAGQRIVRLLVESPISHVPVIVSSVLDGEDVMNGGMESLAQHPHCIYIKKVMGMEQLVGYVGTLAPKKVT